MGKKVFANGMEIAHKAGDGKVIAAFPDVCLSPPAPPAGPVPVPYPNTSKASDLQNGSSNVLIGGKPAALFGQSFYKTSPLGDEAATRSFGGSVVTHEITGKTYFQACSMNVKFEGKKVCRHLDITTSNHMGEQPGSSGPMPNAEAMAAVALSGGGKDDEKCPCCGGPRHSQEKARPPMTSNEFYTFPTKGRPPNKEQANAFKYAKTILEEAKKDGCEGLLHKDDKDPCSRHYPTSARESKDARAEFDTMTSPLTPNEYFSERYGEKLGREVAERARQIRAALADGARSIAHRTPLSGGGCPIGGGNLQPVRPPCDLYEKELGIVQGPIAVYHRQAAGL